MLIIWDALIILIFLDNYTLILFKASKKKNNKLYNRVEINLINLFLLYN